ncbi:serine/threonine protein kinase [Saprolegnia diclina VS20]|uniref:Serine/threonine protein kinase n=1 Tax=Saprolegnia diclina (strain VS20) TaxID=1156394 RepID=T0S516_SAPDV|nr:serine/threonine protein kinase [Saprolegnia diclina VS20]EQC40213.1 serine/threonine protein kinase [Saprolegnia diclina VS20]|eukprot:XP_008606687.1 serine/threonine protein kinase [Saprolegnia diclina VS20]
MVRIALDVIRGVDYLHKKKIVYCDLKSENVLVSDDGHAKLADFGISQQTTRRGDAKQQGTPQYMAPELTGSAAAAPTYASDVYAFGILLTELDANTGMVPYETIDYNNNHFALWKEVRSGLRPALRDDCPLWFRELAVQCMATVPSDRPSVSTIIDILDKNLRDM